MNLGLHASRFPVLGVSVDAVRITDSIEVMAGFPRGDIPS